MEIPTEGTLFGLLDIYVINHIKKTVEHIERNELIQKKRKFKHVLRELKHIHKMYKYTGVFSSDGMDYNKYFMINWILKSNLKINKAISVTLPKMNYYHINCEYNGRNVDIHDVIANHYERRTRSDLLHDCSGGIKELHAECFSTFDRRNECKIVYDNLRKSNNSTIVCNNALNIFNEHQGNVIAEMVIKLARRTVHGWIDYYTRGNEYATLKGYGIAPFTSPPRYEISLLHTTGKQQHTTLFLNEVSKPLKYQYKWREEDNNLNYGFSITVGMKTCDSNVIDVYINKYY